MSLLKESAKQTPIKYVLATALLVGAIISIPTSQFLELINVEQTKNALFISNIIVRLIGIVVLNLLLIKFGFLKVYKEFRVIGLVVAILPLIVAINNFPFIASIKGLGQITENCLTIALFLIWCLTVAVMEEIAFRGIIYPLFAIKLQGKKHGVFWAIVLQGAVFGSMHLLNIIGSSPLAVLLQIGYSFLTGCMFAIVLLYVKNLIVPIILHFIYNAGGLFYDHLGVLSFNNHWDSLTITITAVLAVITIIFMVFALIKKERETSEIK